MDYFVETRPRLEWKDVLINLCNSGDVDGIMKLMSLTFQFKRTNSNTEIKIRNNSSNNNNNNKNSFSTFCAVTLNSKDAQTLFKDEPQSSFNDDSNEGREETLKFLLQIRNVFKDYKRPINDKNNMGSLLTWDPLLLWFRPSYCCLHQIAYKMKNAGLNRISSIGCGSGLLEWLLWKVTGVEVFGYEVNQQWWESKYSPPKFIPHLYADGGIDTPVIPSNHALLSCYFNGEEAFRNYVDRYEGPLLIIIGPLDGFRHTDPHPLTYLESFQWNLRSVHNQENLDLIAFYTRNTS